MSKARPHAVAILALLALVTGCRERNLDAPISSDATVEAVSADAAIRDAESRRRVDAQARSVGEQSELAEVKPLSEARRPELAESLLPAFACNVDSVGDQFFEKEIVVDLRHPAVLRGWGVLSDQSAPSRISVILTSSESAWVVEAARPIARPDVVEAFGADRMLQSGFNVRTILQSVPAGRYAIALLLESDGRAERCDTGKSLNLETSP